MRGFRGKGRTKIQEYRNKGYSIEDIADILELDEHIVFKELS